MYCLIREQWGRVTGEFDLDHLTPQAQRPDQTAAYDNLFYACRTCNLRKGNQIISDPGAALTSDDVRVYPDGSLVGMSDSAARIIRLLCLNSAALTRWRRTWLRIIELVEAGDPELYNQLMEYPLDLPNLANNRSPGNSRPEGIDNSFFARRERGELPDVYFE